MSRLRLLLLAAGIALAGAVLVLLIAAISGMPEDEIGHLALLLLPAVLLSSAAAAAAAPLLARASLRARLLAVALVSTLVALANIGVLAELMLVSEHDAAQVALLLVYSMAAGAGAALATAKVSAGSIERLSLVARRIGEGDLDARVGRLDAGPELDTLASTLDEMAARLAESLGRERRSEIQRRDLVTAVSHDLRTPLAGLRAMVEAIDDRVVEDPATIHRYVGEMRGAVESLVVLVDDLFELVQLDAGAIEAESGRARIEDVVRSAVAACDAQATRKGLELETRLNGTGEASCSPRLTRVVQNLLQNAIRHTPADGTVRVEARHASDGLEVVVEDSGEGIEAAALERVFDPFWRGDEARSGEGSGLGLALAKRIVEALGGSIRAESLPSQGARFAVILPERTAAREA